MGPEGRRRSHGQAGAGEGGHRVATVGEPGGARIVNGKHEGVSSIHPQPFFMLGPSEQPVSPVNTMAYKAYVLF